MYRELAAELAYKIIMGKLSASLPFLTWPIVGRFLILLSDRFLKPAIWEVAKFFDFHLIDGVVSRQTESYKEEVKALKAFQEKYKDTPTGDIPSEEIKDLRDSFHADLSTLIKLRKR